LDNRSTVLELEAIQKLSNEMFAIAQNYGTQTDFSDSFYILKERINQIEKKINESNVGGLSQSSLDAFETLMSSDNEIQDAVKWMKDQILENADLAKRRLSKLETK